MVKFQYWACRTLLAAGPALEAIARSRPQLAPARIRARLAVCREWMDARGMRPGEARDVPVRIALRQAVIAAHWIARRRFPLDDY
jgi:hypothetical protein